MKNILKNTYLVIITLLCSVLFLSACTKECTHNYPDDDNDCTTEVKCLDCDHILIEAKSTHIYPDDDNDCTTEVKCINCEHILIEAQSNHIDNDKDYLCDFGCDELLLTKDIIQNIFQNTISLNEATINYSHFSNSIKEVIYIGKDLIYSISDSSDEYYIYNNNGDNYRLSKISGANEFSEKLLDYEISYNLGYYLKDIVNYKKLENISTYACTYGTFNEKNGYVFDNEQKQKIAIFINDNETLDGFIIIDENNNIIEEYVITHGKKEYDLPTPIVEGRYILGENSEITLTCNPTVRIDYNVYDENQNLLYFIIATSSSYLKYGEPITLDVSYAAGWNGNQLGEYYDIVYEYYQKPRTITFIFDEDHSFLLKHLSVHEIYESYLKENGIVGDGDYGNNKELTIQLDSYTSLSYTVYDENQNDLYWIKASALDVLKYNEPLTFDVIETGGWNGDKLGDLYEMCYYYYQEPRTVTLLFNEDNTFELEYASLDDIYNWHVDIYGQVESGIYGNNNELNLLCNSFVYLTYHVYDENQNYLYWFKAESQNNIKYNEPLVLDVVDAGGWNGAILGTLDLKVSSYYEEPSTVTLTFYEDNTFKLEYASLDDIANWYKEKYGYVESGYYGDYNELRLINNSETIIEYAVYDENNNELYCIVAESSNKLKYDEQLTFDVTVIVGYNGQVLGDLYYAISSYYQEPRTVTLLFNDDNTFELEHASLDEIENWYNSQN